MVKEKIKSSRISAIEILGMAAIAAAAGFAAGMLFAPQSGAKTRKVLNAAIKETMERFKFLILEARVMSEDLVGKGMEKAGEISFKVKTKK
jgi:gas vesicle protein